MSDVPEQSKNCATSPTQQADDHPVVIECSDSVGLRAAENFLTLGNGATGGEVEHIAHGDVGFHTEASSAGPGSSTYRMFGPPPHNEDGVRELCGVLAQVFALHDGKGWVADPSPPSGPEIWIDWCIRSGGEVRAIQVTRVAPQRHWARVGSGGESAGAITAEEAGAEIWAAIQRKLRQQDAGTTLALDARHPGLHGFRLVVEDFVNSYAQQLAHVRFAEVWLVGYTPELTYRLHPTFLAPSRSDA